MVSKMFSYSKGVDVRIQPSGITCKSPPLGGRGAHGEKALNDWQIEHENNDITRTMWSRRNKRGKFTALSVESKLSAKAVKRMSLMILVTPSRQ